MMMIFYGVRDYFSLLEVLSLTQQTFDTPKKHFFPFSFVLARFLLVAHKKKRLSHNGSFLCITISDAAFFSAFSSPGEFFNFMGSFGLFFRLLMHKKAKCLRCVASNCFGKLKFIHVCNYSG